MYDTSVDGRCMRVSTEHSKFNRFLRATEQAHSQTHTHTDNGPLSVIFNTHTLTHTHTQLSPCDSRVYIVIVLCAALARLSNLAAVEFVGLLDALFN